MWMKIYSTFTWNRWHDNPCHASFMASHSLIFYYFQSPFTCFISFGCSAKRISDGQGGSTSFSFSQVQQLWYLGSKVSNLRKVYLVSSTPGTGLLHRVTVRRSIYFTTGTKSWLLSHLLFTLSDVSDRLGFLSPVFVEAEKIGGKIWRMWLGCGWQDWGREPG